jgi:hypothetical protein
MNAVTLKKDGALNLNGKTVATDAIDLLSCQIVLEDVYTLRSFFKMLNKYTLLAKLNAFFPSYMDQYHSCPEQGCDAGLLDYLEFGKTVEMIGVPDKRASTSSNLIRCTHCLNSSMGLHGNWASTPPRNNAS